MVSIANLTGENQTYAMIRGLSVTVHDEPTLSYHPAQYSSAKGGEVHTTFHLSLTIKVQTK